MIKNLFLVIFFVLLVSTVHSASFQAPSIGARATGMGGAFVAVADDPTALYWNPAGLGMCEGTMLMNGTAFIDPYAYYDTQGDGKESSIATDQMIHNLFLTHNFNDSVSVGLGYYVPFGLGQRWEDDSFLRYNSTRSEISLGNLQGGISCRLGDNLLVGAGLAEGFAKINSKSYNVVIPDGVAVSPNPLINAANASEGYVKGWGEARGISGNIGLLWAPSDNWTVGCTWRSETKVKFKGDIDINPQTPIDYNKYDRDFSMDFNFPQTASLGVSYSGFDRWLLSTEVDWVNWSRMDTLTQELDSPVNIFNPLTFATTTTDEMEISRDWKDRYILRLGAEYEVNPQFTLRGGYMWDPSPVPPETLDPMMFDVSSNRFFVGASFQIWRANVDVAYAYSQGIRREADDSENAFPTDGDYWGHSHMVELSTTYAF